MDVQVYHPVICPRCGADTNTAFRWVDEDLTLSHCTICGCTFTRRHAGGT